MFVIKHKKIFFTITTILVLASIVAIAIFGLDLGIDFTGGSILEVSYPSGRPAIEKINSQIDTLPIGNTSIRPYGENSIVVRTKFLNEEERNAVIGAVTLGGAEKITEERFNSIGPVIGEELKTKAYIAIGIVILAIILFVAFAFRKVSEPVSSWKYGLVAIIALIHDILIPTGIFAVLGMLIGAEVDALFIMALLAILGYSVNDTIVVFDRIRENLMLNKKSHNKESFDETVGKSLNQTYVRSLNTSLTTLFVLLALFFFGGSITHNFVLTLILGVIAGTYSSIFLASPLLVVFNRE